MKFYQIIIFLSLFCTACKPAPNAKKAKEAKEDPTSGVVVVTAGADPLAKYQWHLINHGNHYLIGDAGLTKTSRADINLGPLHQQGITGRGVVIAISDTDMQYSHADLFENFSLFLSRNYNYANPHSRAPLSNLSRASHATAVAGLAAASMNNSIGGKGVAPEATLAGLNYLSAPETSLTTIDQASGESIDIFNYSYGYDTCSVNTRDNAFTAALKSGVETQRQSRGSIYIKAAGNEYVGYQTDCDQLADSESYYFGNANYDPDNTTPYTILVGAINSSGVSSNFSTPGANLWISAPGGGTEENNSPLVTTDVMGCTHGYSNNQDSNVTNNFERGRSSLNSLCDYTADVSGTSFAAPLVSGVVALMLQVNPSLKWRDIKHILAKTAVPIGSPIQISQHPLADESLAGHKYDLGMIQNQKGYFYSNYYGFGRLNAEAAVDMAAKYNLNLGDFISHTVESTHLPKVILDKSAVGVTSVIRNENRLNIEAIEMKINTSGVAVSDLGIELTSPSGITVTVTNINSNNITTDFSYDTPLLINAFYREAAYGEWTIKVIDGKQTPGQAANLISTSLTFYGTVNEI